ncbi:MAG TPA: class I SAM-dependent methyltransferase [Terriglobales bacterium]
MPATDATQRFSSRVEKYVRYRPGYPPEIIPLLQAECGLTAGSVIADVAFGTGLFTKLLLENGNRVLGVEPNADMRRAGEEFLASYSRFTAVSGKAEATSLADASVDFVTAAQAAHWFDCDKARREFVRILKPGGWLILIWNERQINSPFLRDYEALLLKYATDYQEIRHEHTTAKIGDFFAPQPFQERQFELLQVFDYTGVEGRLLSSSYTPPAGDPRFEPMIAELQRIFRAHAVDGKAVFAYITRVFFGRLK